MAVRDRDFLRTLLGPTKNDAPLVVDPDRVTSRRVAPEWLEAIAWRNGEVRQLLGGVHRHEFAQGDTRYLGKTAVCLFAK